MNRAATLELGGKSANIFFEDCDWEMAMDGLQMGILFNQGQVCCAGSRVFVQESIYDRFVEEAVKRFNKVKVGLPWKEETQMGSQIDRRQKETITGKEFMKMFRDMKGLPDPDEEKEPIKREFPYQEPNEIEKIEELRNTELKNHE